MREFQGLRVWSRAHELVLAVYRVTHDFQQEERHGLSEEIRRSARRIPAAIVAGCGQPDDSDMRPFLAQAVEATMALEYALILARDLGYLPEAVHIRTCADIAAVRRLLLTAMTKLSTPFAPQVLT